MLETGWNTVSDLHATLFIRHAHITFDDLDGAMILIIRQNINVQHSR